jgi:hypothetical protein
MMLWSSAGLRFCTSELKIEPICRELVRRFPGRRILRFRVSVAMRAPPRESGSVAHPAQVRKFEAAD